MIDSTIDNSNNPMRDAFSLIPFLVFLFITVGFNFFEVLLDYVFDTEFGIEPIFLLVSVILSFAFLWKAFGSLGRRHPKAFASYCLPILGLLVGLIFVQDVAYLQEKITFLMLRKVRGVCASPTLQTSGKIFSICHREEDVFKQTFFVFDKTGEIAQPYSLHSSAWTSEVKNERFPFIEERECSVKARLLIDQFYVVNVFCP